MQVHQQLTNRPVIHCEFDKCKKKYYYENSYKKHIRKRHPKSYEAYLLKEKVKDKKTEKAPKSLKIPTPISEVSTTEVKEEEEEEAHTPVPEIKLQL